MKLFPLEPFADQIALVDIDEGREISYRTLLELELKWQEILGSERQLAFLFTQNDWREVAAYVALLNGGHVVCLLDRSLEPSLKQALVARYGPQLIIDAGGYSGYRELAAP